MPIKPGSKTAMSLVEVLVVLAISATTLVAAAQITVRMMITVKDNETADFVNGLMLQALEIAKNPADVVVDSPTPVTNFEGSYRIILGTPSVLWKESSTTTPLTNCASNSPYLLDVSDQVSAIGARPVVCLQIIASQKRNLSQQVYYKVETRVLYSTASKQFTNTVEGYRRGEFKTAVKQ